MYIYKIDIYSEGQIFSCCVTTHSCTAGPEPLHVLEIVTRTISFTKPEIMGCEYYGPADPGLRQVERVIRIDIRDAKGKLSNGQILEKLDRGMLPKANDALHWKARKYLAKMNEAQEKYDAALKELRSLA